MDKQSFKYNFTLAGKVNDPAFHKCFSCLKYLQQANPQTVSV